MTANSFREFMKHTKPAPQPRCPECETIGLRTYVDPETREEKVVCTNIRCAASPLRQA